MNISTAWPKSDIHTITHMDISMNISMHISMASLGHPLIPFSRVMGIVEIREHLRGAGRNPDSSQAKRRSCNAPTKRIKIVTIIHVSLAQIMSKLILRLRL